MKDRSFLENNGVDVEKGLELLGDMDMYNETMGDFLNEINEKYPNAKNYKELGDMPNYAILVHSIKSDSKYLGFTHLNMNLKVKKMILNLLIIIFQY